MRARIAPRTPSARTTWWRRLGRETVVAMRDAGAVLAAGPNAGIQNAPHLERWRDALRPEAQVLWIQHDARRDEWVQPLAPIESVVSDGLLMAHVAVRMSLKNRIIVSALRDHLDFDHAALERFAQTEFVRLASENEQAATRLYPITTALPPAAGRALADQLGLEAQRRRPAVHRALASALIAASAEPDLLQAMVVQAEADAADEFGQAVVAGVITRDPTTDADYRAPRPERVRALIRKDLKALELASAPHRRTRRDRWASTRRTT